jgi:hypothetical protein
MLPQPPIVEMTRREPRTTAMNKFGLGASPLFSSLSPFRF